MTRALVCSALLAALFATPSTAFADPGPGALRLSLEERVFGMVHYPEDGQARFRLGVFGTNLFFLEQPMLTFGLGYQATEQFLVGARLGFGYQEFSLAGNQESGLFGVIPFGEFLFGEGDFLPFFGAQVGFQMVFYETGFGGGLETEAFFVAGGMGGIHIFAEDGFSVTPGIGVDFLYFSGFERAGWQVIATIALEGWIGGGGSGRSAPAREPAPEREREPAPTPAPAAAPPPTDPEGGLD